MNYDLMNGGANTAQSGYDNFTIDQGLRYGQMPHELLAVKFEETDLGYDDEEDFDNYARQTLMDRGPDTAMTAADEPRRNSSGWGGRLNLRLHGTRGSGDLPNHGEMFLGEIDTDPRAHVVEPNMGSMREQWSARTRYQRWTPDDQATTTGGGRSERQVMADRQTGFRWVRDRLRVFSRQIDGRRSGASGSWKTVSRALRVERERGRSRPITDAALMRRRQIIETLTATRDTTAYRESTRDQESTVTVLGQARRSGRAVATAGARGRIQSADSRWSAESASKQFRSAGQLLSKIVAIRDKMVVVPRDHDSARSGVADDTTSMARKHERAVRDLAALFAAVVQDGRLGTSGESMSRRHGRVDGGTAPLPVVFNHAMPEHMLHVPELMYKAASLPRDIRKVAEAAVRDEVVAAAAIESMRGKAAAAPHDSTRAARAMQNEVKDSTRATYNYRRRRVEAPTAAGVSGERFARRGRESQFRRARRAPEHLGADRTADVSAAKFGDNMAPVRHGGRLGNKTAVRRAADRETTGGGVLDDL